MAWEPGRIREERPYPGSDNDMVMDYVYDTGKRDVRPFFDVVMYARYGPSPVKLIRALVPWSRESFLDRIERGLRVGDWWERASDRVIVVQQWALDGDPTPILMHQCACGHTHEMTAKSA